LEHVNWTREQWLKVLWTDETWVTSIYHRRIYVTRKAGEEYDDTCVRDRVSRAPGWMFWGSFYGNEKGPCLFWEKEWGSIDSDSYTARIVPLIHGMVTMSRDLGTHLIVMQDGAPSHRNLLTIEELHERGIFPINWPPYSPDLNPIEQLWDYMKDWIGDRYLAAYDRKLSYDQLREAVRAAWDAIPPSFLDKQIDLMQARCQAVIDANGGYTPY